ncbi:hypothetical protein DRQ20_05185 [bacterium]|nr:MAG: hypothetical protein DRQ20_05185 [bacterium]
MEGTPFDFEISPDGKIVGAVVYPIKDGKSLGKYLFFLDVETGRTKLVKAEGKKGERKWSASFDLRENKKIGLNGGWWDIKIAQSVETTFDELPSDLSVLFEQGEKN